MWASVGVDAGIGELEAFDGAAVDEMFLDDLFGVSGVDEAVPYGVRIDGDDGSVLALVEATGGVDADAVLEASLFDGVFEGVSELVGVLVGTAGAGGGFVALVDTDEEVVLVRRHIGSRFPEALGLCF